MDGLNISEQSDQVAPSSIASGTSDYVDRVRAYYDRTSSLYLNSLGATFQSGIVDPNRVFDSVSNSNRFLAHRARLASGMRVLDAGCGVCGPAIDIAQAFPGIEICSITISPVQCEIAQKLICEANLTASIKVFLADFHDLPFASASFDCAFFLESMGYTQDTFGLASEIFRVLRPGGQIYSKDVFRKSAALNHEEKRELIAFEETYLYSTAFPQHQSELLREVGFTDVQFADLDSITSTKRFNEAMIVRGSSPPAPTEFGRIQITAYNCLPLQFGDLTGTRSRKTLIGHQPGRELVLWL
jgi:ubiquinone/menaquinone biosynthesis C-methylase UbiE